jgi:hypothetical protein
MALGISIFAGAEVFQETGSEIQLFTVILKMGYNRA